MDNNLIPVFICVVLPVAIVSIVYAAKINSDNKRAQVLIKAIESNNSIDADKLAEVFRTTPKSALQILNRRLLLGCIFAFPGFLLCVFLIIFSLITGKFHSDLLPLFMLGVAVMGIGISYLVVYFVTRKQIKD